MAFRVWCGIAQNEEEYKAQAIMEDANPRHVA
jgi:hypothetical protein